MKVLFFLLISVAILVIWLPKVEQPKSNWEIFKKKHDCRVTSYTQGSADVPDKTTYKCFENGLIYTVNESGFNF